MADEEIIPGSMRPELERRFLENSETIEVSSGKVFISTRSSSELLGVDTFGELWFRENDDSGAAEFFDIYDIDDVYTMFGAEDREALISNAEVGAGPPSWYWWVEAFRAGDRGYITVNLWDAEYEPREPILGAWEPYDSTEAFETCFVEVYRKYFDPIWIATTYDRGGQITDDLFRRALLAAVTASEYYADLFQAKAEYFDINNPVQGVDRYIREAERDEV